MSSLLFFYKSAPFTESRFDTLCNLAAAAIEKKIDVSIFFDFDATFTTVATQQSFEMFMLPKDRISELMELGANIYLCEICSAMRGVKHFDIHTEGINFISMEKLSSIIAKTDKVISF